jgi:hypothetical protein
MLVQKDYFFQPRPLLLQGKDGAGEYRPSDKDLFYKTTKRPCALRRAAHN